MGVDNALLTREIRKLFSMELGIAPKELHEQGSVLQLRVGSSTGLKPRVQDKHSSIPQCYEFDTFRLDVRERLLMRDRKLVSVPLKVLETLVLLVERHGQILEKSYLMKELWPDTHVGVRSLAQNIFTLRKVLGGEHAQFVETLSKRGYRFIAPVEALNEDSQGLGRRPIGRDSYVDLVADIVTIRLLAVLPFKVLGSEPDGHFLGLGLADALITRLSKLNRIIVRPTSAVAKYTESGQDLISVGRELGVDSIIDGRIQKSGDKIRVTVQLVNAHNGAPLWAHAFNGDLAKIFSLQDVMSKRVAHALRLRLSAVEQIQLTKHDTDNAAAYQLYVKGRFHWNTRTAQGLLKAIECFKQAIKLDPNYALSHAGLADSFIMLDLYGEVPPKQSHPKAIAAVKWALDIDPNLVEAVTSLAFVRAFVEWDWDRAEREFKRALNLNPNYATAHHWYAEYLSAMNRPDEAIAAIVRAHEIEPLSLIINCNFAWIFSLARKYDLAIEQLQQTLELDPRFHVIYSELGFAYAQKRMYADAIAALEKGEELCPGDRYLKALLGYAYGMAGSTCDSQKALQRLRGGLTGNYVSPYLLSLVHMGCGENNIAIQYLNQSFEERSVWLTYLDVNPMFDPLRTDSRFMDLVQRIKQPLQPSRLRKKGRRELDAAQVL